VLRRNVLIFHQAALGDFVLTWPLAIALGRLYPQSRIKYVTASSKGRLAERVLGVDSLDAETGWPTLFSERPNPPEPVLRALSGAHAIFDFGAGPNTLWSANIAQLAPAADLLHLPTKPPADDADARHVVEHLMQSLAARPAVATAVEQILRSVRDRGVAARRTVGQAIVIHPGSGSPTKNWPLENFIEMAGRVKAMNRPVRFLVGEVERECLMAEQIAQLSTYGELIEPTDYVHLHASLIDAAVYVGNDSGPTHLAAMCGVPTVALLVRPNAKVWAPVGPRVSVLEGEAIAIDKVLARINALIATSDAAPDVKLADASDD
jgi:ADP-heptose:LPS heptosyltransferase